MIVYNTSGAAPGGTQGKQSGPRDIVVIMQAITKQDDDFEWRKKSILLHRDVRFKIYVQFILLRSICNRNLLFSFLIKISSLIIR